MARAHRYERLPHVDALLALVEQADAPELLFRESVALLVHEAPIIVEAQRTGSLRPLVVASRTSYPLAEPSAHPAAGPSRDPIRRFRPPRGSSEARGPSQAHVRVESHRPHPPAALSRPLTAPRTPPTSGARGRPAPASAGR
jgi:hypothetical protein